MSFEKVTTCPDFTRRFDGFFDGELDPDMLRSMALHASQCDQCGADLQRAERLKDLLSTGVAEVVENLDTSQLWTAIESKLERPRRSWSRARIAAARVARPAVAFVISGAVAALLALWLWPQSTPPQSVEVANNHAQIDRIESSSPHVAVWSEPERHTTAIWVTSYDPEGSP